MSETEPEFDPSAFLKKLREDNAEDLKNRILKRFEEQLKNKGEPCDVSKHIQIDLLDFFND